MYRILFASSLLLAVGVSAAITTAYGDASPDDGKPVEATGGRAARAVLFEARLVGLKAALALTSDQEKNWSGFEGAVRELAKARRAARGIDESADKDNDEEPSPIDRMRKWSDRLERRAAALKTFADASAPLYASLDQNQKFVFRAMLRDYWRAHHRGQRE